MAIGAAAVWGAIAFQQSRAAGVDAELRADLVRAAERYGVAEPEGVWRLAESHHEAAKSASARTSGSRTVYDHTRYNAYMAARAAEAAEAAGADASVVRALRSFAGMYETPG